MPFPKIKLSDDSGNAVGVTDNRLNVNAYLAATPTIDIGDVSLLLGGTAADTGAGVYGAQTLRVIMALDDPLLSAMNANLFDIEALLTTIDADTGSYLGNLGFLANLARITGNVATTAGHYGTGALAVRNDVAEAWAGIDDGDYTFLQTNSVGSLYTTGSEVENAAVQSEPTLIGGRYDSSARTLGNGDAGAVALNASGHMIMDVVDGGQLDTIIDTLETTLTAIETDQAAIEALLITIDSDTDAIKTATQLIDDAIHVDDAAFTLGSHKGVMMMGYAGTQNVNPNDAAALACGTDGKLIVSGTVTANLGTTDNTVLDNIANSLALLDNSIASGNELQVDVVAALPAGTNAIGKLSANSGVDIGDVDVTSISAGSNIIGKVGHDITGMVSGVNSAVSDSTAEQLDGSTDSSLDVACKRVDLMATQSNTGDIWVGDSGVTSNGAGGGMQLKPGDFYSIDVNNLNDIWVMATVDGENIHYMYFT